MYSSHPSRTSMGSCLSWSLPFLFILHLSLDSVIDHLHSTLSITLDFFPLSPSWYLPSEPQALPHSNIHYCAIVLMLLTEKVPQTGSLPSWSQCLQSLCPSLPPICLVPTIIVAFISNSRNNNSWESPAQHHQTWAGESSGQMKSLKNLPTKFWKVSTDNVQS